MVPIIRVKDALGNAYNIPAIRGVRGYTGAAGPKGDPGKDFKVLGYYDTLLLLQAAVTTPEAGDAYGVGTAAPYTIYIYDGVNSAWVDNGTIQGAAGADGTDGREVEFQTSATHIQWRYVGVATWTDLIALSALKGADGADGAAGADGAPGADGAAGVGISSVTFKETDVSGNAVYTITLTNATTYDFTAPKGPAGADGASGADGAAGPNEVSSTTATALNGILKGNGTNVTTATENTDYAGATHASRHATGGGDAITPANIGAAALDGDSKVTAAQASAAIVEVTGSLTLGSTHYGRMLRCTNSAAITLTMPTDIPVGTEIEIYRAGAGAVTLSAASGVTVECKEATYGVADQYTAVVLKWVAANTVAIVGNVG